MSQQVTPQVPPQVPLQVPQVTQDQQQVAEVAGRAAEPKPASDGALCTSADPAISHNLLLRRAFHSKKDFVRKLPLQVSISERYIGNHENR